MTRIEQNPKTIENMIHKIKTLTGPIPPEILEQFKGRERACGFYTSRLALKTCLEEISPNTIWSWDNLAVKNNLHLENHPEILVSLSHTKTVGAAVVAKSENIRSVGIDIEFIDRKINPETCKYFINENDTHPDNLLLTWTLKEAAFKAISPIKNNSGDRMLLLKDIWIGKNKFGLSGEHSPVGGLTHMIHTECRETFLIALAWIN